MCALKIRDDPSVDATNVLIRDLDVPGRHAAVERDAEVALGPADDEAGLAEPDDLAVDPPVVVDGQVGDRWTCRRPERAGRPRDGAVS